MRSSRKERSTVKRPSSLSSRAGNLHIGRNDSLHHGRSWNRHSNGNHHTGLLRIYIGSVGYRCWIPRVLRINPCLMFASKLARSRYPSTLGARLKWDNLDHPSFVSTIAPISIPISSRLVSKCCPSDSWLYSIISSVQVYSLRLFCRSIWLALWQFGSSATAFNFCPANRRASQHSPAQRPRGDAFRPHLPS